MQIAFLCAWRNGGGPQLILWNLAVGLKVGKIFTGPEN